ncbi:MAG: hypothetical protein PHC28_11730 [Flavobacterium sp.]|uniref:toprim domain-containing protein n=1 Tax=Flavobacterium sp. TaxID=239 RepID=UPI0026136B2C|nr:toprim domain-containing protein [Flavobacterium sp.]MDD5151123.1 hypothetical protein [Flavobacterium sp.]
MNAVDLKYVGLISWQLERFKKIRDSVYLFRCPFCGDSKKKKNLCRGYIYDKNNTTLFNCFNCGAGMTLGTFIRELDYNQYLNYKLETFQYNHQRITHKEEIKEIEIIKSTEQKLLESDYGLKYCYKLSDIRLPDDLRVVYDYARKRKIPSFMFDSLYACRNLNLIAKNFPKYSEMKFPEFPILVMPFFKKDGTYDYMQCRHIIKNEDKSAKRFTIFEINDGIKLFGIDRIDYTKRITILEGPIDSMFIENSLATCGVSFDVAIEYLKEYNNKDIVLCFDNDYKSNPDVKKQLIRKIEEGYSVVLYDNRFKWKDINDAVTKGGWDYNKINHYLRERTFSGLYAKIEVTRK